MSGPKFMPRAAVGLAILAFAYYMYVRAGMLAALVTGGSNALLLFTLYVIWRPMRQPPFLPLPPTRPNPTPQPPRPNQPTRAKELAA